MTTTQKICYYVLLTLVSLLFLFSGWSKLASVPAAVQSFQIAHLPIWFMYFVGTCEILGAIGLWFALSSRRKCRMLARRAAYGLFIILIGAVVVSAVFVNIPTALFPLIVGVILWVIVWLGDKRPIVKSDTPLDTPASSTPAQN